jgi:peptidoglycan/xylan/chitin deacetylase (PgdA/CDA1 family)
MYHVIADPPAKAPFPALYVSPAEFRAQMAWLADRGYRGVTLTQVYDHWRYGRPLPKRPIVITFDDGYRSIFEQARPVLAGRRWPGVVDLEARFIDKPWGLAKSRIRVLLASGWELASHTLTHPDLTSLSAAQLRREVSGSRVELRRAFHVPVSFFCYPAGRYDARVIAAVQAARYLGATSTRPGLARPNELWDLARIRIDRGDGVAGLQAKLRAAGG